MTDPGDLGSEEILDAPAPMEVRGDSVEILQDTMERLRRPVLIVVASALGATILAEGVGLLFRSTRRQRA